MENFKAKQVNLVVIPSNRIDFNNLKMDDISSTIIDVFSNAKPVFSKYPDFFICLEPNNQFNLNIIGIENKIIISDNRITEYTGRDLSNFYNLARRLIEIICANGVKDYGFNIIGNFDLSSNADSALYIKNKFVSLPNFNGNVLIGAGANIIFKDADIRFNLRMEPVFNQEMQPTKSIEINQNAHFSGSPLPSLAEMQTKLNGIYSNLFSSLSTVISE